MLSKEPEVKLINYFNDFYYNAVAAARTCYSSSVVYAENIKKDEKSRKRADEIAESIYKAGHHTVFQHAHFQFVLTNVSRQFLWSFLHSHPYYNSEQVSQRYVEVKPENFAIPPLGDDNVRIYTDTINMQMEAYKDLIEMLEKTANKEYENMYLSGQTTIEKQRSTVRKKQQEVARYILPVATHANLYHTVNALTLFRYFRICGGYDVPFEQKRVIEKMVEEVKKVEPKFFDYAEDPISLERTLEYKTYEEFNAKSKIDGNFSGKFDKELDNLSSKLIDYKVNTEKSLKQAVCAVIGADENAISEYEAADLILNPAKNGYICETLNLNTVSKLMKALNHVNFTFKKKISHSADSQDQRHRSVLGSRPVMFRHFIDPKPDYIVPELIKADEKSREFYGKTMGKVWENIHKLLNNGEKPEYVFYLLPNAYPIRFIESGDLMGFHHKWTKRLCYTVQEELWNNCLDEVKQIKDKFPAVAEHILAPCYLRKTGNVKPYCPEGERFCGKDVWNLKIEEYKRIL